MTDDSEEIFRRASENYPLKTDNADWEAVLKKMEDDNKPVENVNSRKRSYRSLLLLLLLLPFAVIEYKYSSFSRLFKTNKQQQTVSKVSASEKPTPGTMAQSSQENSIHSSVATDVNQTASSTQRIDKPNHQAVDQNNNNTTNALVIAPANQVASLTHNPGITNNKKVLVNTVSSNADNKSSVVLTNEKINAAHRKPSFGSKQKTKVQIANVEASGDETTNNTNTVSPEKNNTPIADPAKENMLAQVHELIAKKEAEEKKPAPEVNNTPVKENVPVNAVAKTADKPDSKIETKENTKKKSHQPHFYAGLIAGPDFSTIKLQSVKKTGIGYGLIAGYRINNKFSIETGFLKDKKFYSSKGEYFSTKNIHLPAYASINSVTGNCTMYELPLNVHYTFSHNANSSWFGSAGFSSYFMNREAYVFDVTRYGSSYPYNANYTKHDNQFAAVINFSVGYTHKIGRIGDLRIEPYLKLPVNKMGTGELPIQSGGLLIGITRNIF